MTKRRDIIDARKTREQAALLEQFRKIPIIQIACEKAGIGRATYYRWRKESPDFALAADEALQDGVSLVSDMAESQLLSQIRDGNLGAVTYWLKHRNPAYSSRLEVTAKLEEKDPLTEEQQALIRQAIRFASLPTSLSNHGDPSLSTGISD